MPKGTLTPLLNGIAASIYHVFPHTGRSAIQTVNSTNLSSVASSLFSRGLGGRQIDGLFFGDGTWCRHALGSCRLSGCSLCQVGLNVPGDLRVGIATDSAGVGKRPHCALPSLVGWDC